MKMTATLTNGRRYNLVFRYHHESEASYLNFNEVGPDKDEIEVDSEGWPIIERIKDEAGPRLTTVHLIDIETGRVFARGFTVRPRKHRHVKELARHYALVELGKKLSMEDYQAVLDAYEARKPRKTEAGNA